MPRRRDRDPTPPPPPPEFGDALGLAQAIHLVKGGVPVADAAILCQVDEAELELAAVELQRAHAAFTAEMVGIVASGARAGDWKAAAWLLERLVPAFRRPTAGEQPQQAGPERIVEMPSNGRLRLQ